LLRQQISANHLVPSVGSLGDLAKLTAAPAAAPFLLALLSAATAHTSNQPYKLSKHGASYSSSERARKTLLRCFTQTLPYVVLFPQISCAQS
jgi:hypothetical protein